MHFYNDLLGFRITDTLDFARVRPDGAKSVAELKDKKISVRDGGSLRKCVAAGEALPAATRALWKEATGIEIIDGIGATEMFHIFISADEANARPGATGKAVPGYRAKVVDDEGRELPPGTIGKLAVQGATGCRYLDDERQANYVKGGWNYTGDAYLMDADGKYLGFFPPGTAAEKMVEMIRPHLAGSPQR